MSERRHLPWEAPALSTEERDSRFARWTIEQLDAALDDVSEEDLIADAQMVEDQRFSDRVSNTFKRAQKIYKAKDAVARMLKTKDEAEFVRLTRDQDVARYVARRLWRPRGRARKQPRKGQLFFDAMDQDLLDILDREVSLVLEIWKRNNIKRSGRDGFPTAEKIVVQRLVQAIDAGQAGHQLSRQMSDVIASHAIPQPDGLSLKLSRLLSSLQHWRKNRTKRQPSPKRDRRKALT